MKGCGKKEARSSTKGGKSLLNNHKREMRKKIAGRRMREGRECHQPGGGERIMEEFAFTNAEWGGWHPEN